MIISNDTHEDIQCFQKVATVQKNPYIFHHFFTKIRYRSKNPCINHHLFNIECDKVATVQVI